MHWEHQYSPTGVPSPFFSRGCWIIFTPEEMVDQDWDIIKDLTANGDLGYMSTKSPDEMRYGEYAGFYTICVHTIADAGIGIDGNSSVREVLQENGFSYKIQRYQINYVPDDDNDSKDEESDSETDDSCFSNNSKRY